MLRRGRALLKLSCSPRSPTLGEGKIPSRICLTIYACTYTRRPLVHTYKRTRVCALVIEAPIVVQGVVGGAY